MAIQTENPATGEIIKVFEPHSDDYIAVSYTHLTLPTIYSV